MSKPNALDYMMAADGELAPAEVVALGPEAADTEEAVAELGALVRGHLELAADEAEPRLAGLWELVERRLDHESEDAVRGSAQAPAASASGWSRLWGWLSGRRSHLVTGLVSAGAVAGLALAFRPAGQERVVWKTVSVPAVAPQAILAPSRPEVESLEVTGGTGTVFTVADEDGETAVIWVEPDEADPTEGI